MKRCMKKGQTKTYQGEKKEKRKEGGKKRSLCGGLDQEYWWGPTVIQGCKSGRLIVDVKLPRHHNRKYETECEGKGAGL